MEHDQMEFNPQEEQAVQQPQTEAQSAAGQEINDMVYFLELLKHLRATVTRGKRIPMSSRVMVEADTCMKIIDELEQNLPDAIQYGMQMYSEKKRIMDEAENAAISRVTTAEMKANKAIERARQESEQIVRDARDEAQGILEDAHERADFLISESEIMTQAKEEARRLKSDVRVEVSELRLKANHDVHCVMTDVEASLNNALKAIRNLHSQINSEQE